MSTNSNSDQQDIDNFTFGSDSKSTETQENAMDDWASALAEQTAAQDTPQAASPVAAPAPIFAPLTGDGERLNLDLDALKDVPVQVTVELGRARLTIRELLQLGQGSVVELMGLAGEPLDILINGHLIAQGEVVVVDENYGVRLTDILTPSDRLHRLTSPR